MTDVVTISTLILVLLFGFINIIILWIIFMKYNVIYKELTSLSMMYSQDIANKTNDYPGGVIPPRHLSNQSINSRNGSHLQHNLSNSINNLDTSIDRMTSDVQLTPWEEAIKVDDIGKSADEFADNKLDYYKQFQPINETSNESHSEDTPIEYLDPNLTPSCTPLSSPINEIISSDQPNWDSNNFGKNKSFSTGNIFDRVNERLNRNWSNPTKMNSSFNELDDEYIQF